MIYHIVNMLGHNPHDNTRKPRCFFSTEQKSVAQDLLLLDLILHFFPSLLGHIIRADPQDPMRQVLFLPNSLIPRIEHARWVGKPRAHWLIETYADAYRESGHVDQFDINNILQK